MAEESEEKEKKGLFHKFKAFKRRSVLIIASKIGGAENTVDEAYDDQHEAFLKVQSEMKDVKLACEQTIKSMEQFVAQNLVVAEKFSTMLPQDGQFCKIGFVLGDTSGSASSRMSQMRERLMVEVVSVIDDQLKKFQELQFLHDKRGRRLLDYDAYRRQVDSMIQGKLGTAHPEYSDKKAKQDRSFKEYQSLAERLMVEYQEIETMKSTLVAAPALALAKAQLEFFEKGVKDFQPHLCELGSDVSDSIRSNMSKISQNRLRYASMSDAEWYQQHQERLRDDGATGGVATMSLAAPPPSAPPAAAKAAVAQPLQPVAETPSAPRPPAPPPAKAKVTARALFSYDATNEEELTLVENQVIEVTKEDDSGWWQGIVDGKEGWFPANYVEKL